MFPNVFTPSLRCLLLGDARPTSHRLPGHAPPTRPATYLKELLDDVVPEHVHHELVGGLQDLAEDQLALGGAGPLQLQLDEPEPEGKKGLMFDLMTGTGPSFERPAQRNAPRGGRASGLASLSGTCTCRADRRSVLRPPAFTPPRASELCGRTEQRAQPPGPGAAREGRHVIRASGGEETGCC